MTYEHELITARIAAELPPRLPMKSTADLARAAVQAHHLIRQLTPSIQFHTNTLLTFEEGLDGQLEVKVEDLEKGGSAACPAAHVAVLFAVDQELVIRPAGEGNDWSTPAPWEEPIEVRTHQVSHQLYTLAHLAKLTSEPGSVFEENAEQAKELARANMTLSVAGGEGRCLN